MTVAELITELQKQDPDAQVLHYSPEDTYRVIGITTDGWPCNDAHTYGKSVMLTSGSFWAPE